MAIAPAFAVLGAGRLIAGLGLGAIAAVGPVYGRTVGGVLGAGLFGGSSRRASPSASDRQRRRRRRRQLADRIRRLRGRRLLGAGGHEARRLPCRWS